MRRRQFRNVGLLVSFGWSLLFAACGGGSGSGGNGSGGVPGGTGGRTGAGGAGGGVASGPAITPVGTPTGPARTARIGTAGGTLQTADGMIELVVPPGALAVEAELSLTPISGEAPLSVGPAVRLGPDGTNFATPAKLVLHYEPYASGTEPDLLLAASQDAGGRWLPAGPPELDTAAKTVSVPVPHFSDWSFAACARLEISNYIVGPEVPSELSVQEQCNDPQAQTEPLFPARLTTARVDWMKQDATGMPGPGTLTPQGAMATLTTTASAPPDPRVFVSADWQGPSARRRLQDTVWVGAMLDFSVDGHTVIVSDGMVGAGPVSSFVTTVGGKTVVSALSPMGALTVSFVGGGVGGFVTGPPSETEAHASIIGSDGTAAEYADTWSEPCTSIARAVVTRVSVSHANRERAFIRGSFRGQLSITRGETTCNGNPVPDVKIVALSGTFVTRWSAFQ